MSNPLPSSDSCAWFGFNLDSPDGQSRAERALKADSYHNLLVSLREKLHRAGRGKVEIPDVSAEAAFTVHQMLCEMLDEYGIVLE